MKPIDRRTFLAGSAAAGLISGFSLPAAALGPDGPASVEGSIASAEDENAFPAAVDFSYAPADFQSTICFPDDPCKKVIAKRRELRYDFPADIFAGVDQFGTIVEFTLAGMGQDLWLDQQMESPALPIVHTRLKRRVATLELITFATQSEGEGRVDYVLMEVRPAAQAVMAAPVVRFGHAETSVWVRRRKEPTESIVARNKNRRVRAVRSTFPWHLSCMGMKIRWSLTCSLNVCMNCWRRSTCQICSTRSRTDSTDPSAHRMALLRTMRWFNR